MKKTSLFILSITVAFGITLYIKDQQSKRMAMVKPHWKTFVKTPASEVNSHSTTNEEFLAAKIPVPETQNTAKAPSRTIASVDPMKGFMVRNQRILTGEVEQKYEDENIDLKMMNAINPKWKDIMGHELMRFQPEETKLMVKEEVPVIKIQDGYGRFLEQVSITYLQKNGNRSSFKALVDSDTGFIVETWDRTIQEQIRRPRGELTLPPVNESGIVTR